MWGERPVRGELKSSEEEEEEQEGEREAGVEGRARLKLSRGDDVEENVPLQKGAPKRGRERSGGTLRAPSSWERSGGGVGWGGVGWGGNHPDVGKTPGAEGETDS